MTPAEARSAAPVCGYCGTRLVSPSTGRRRYCDTKCRVAGHRERREAEAAAGQIHALESTLADAHEALIAAADSVVDAARFDQEPASGTLLPDLVHASNALADLGAAARKLRDARLLAARYGISADEADRVALQATPTDL